MTTAADPAPSLAELPEPVRARIVALAAAVLPQVPDLPPPLRRIAAFAPARRARAGGAAIAAALEVGAADEDGLRARLAVQLRDARAADEEAGPVSDPAEAAALGWLLRPEAWHDRVAAAVRELQSRPPVDEAEAARLRRRVAQLEDDVRELRERRRVDVETLKQENTALRRKLGEERVSGREALGDATEALAAAETARAAAVAATESQDRELRQLRARVAQLEAEAGTERRTVRSEREEATLRARLLLDTVLDAAAGLRRELALPPAEGTPGEAVESAYAVSPGPTERQRGVAGVGELEGYLAMPRARLIVDGYNLSKQAWPTSPLDAQRIRLLQALAPLVARTGAETTVVFDAANVAAGGGRQVPATPRGVKVLFSPAGVIADDVIRELVAAEPSGRVVLVVTDDQAVARDVARAGARSVPTSVLLQQLR